jgi:GMP synthase (glutamine-hydrolysing)
MDPVRLLLVLPGSLPASLAARCGGDFDLWFERALTGEPIDWHKARLYAGEPLPAPEGIDGAIVAGSLASLTAPEPWMDHAAFWIRSALKAHVAVLGVCFGHQLLGHAFGARIVRNPAGPEFGSSELALTDEGARDLLFDGLGPSLLVHETHEDIVAEPPPGARVLASNRFAGVQAMAVGPLGRGVQFHPEMRLEEARALCDGHACLGLEPTSAGDRILRNFVRHFASRSGRARAATLEVSAR